MLQTQPISNVIGWERRLELTEERRKNHRSEPFVNYLAAPQFIQKEREHPQKDQAPADFVKALNSNLQSQVPCAKTLPLFTHPKRKGILL